MKKTILISQFDVLAVFGNDVNLRGTFLEDTEKSEECVLLVSRDAYINIINSFLDDKKGICEANGHFCGLESIYSDDWTDTGKTTELSIGFIGDGDDHKQIYKEVLVIRVNSFETEIEHG